MIVDATDSCHVAAFEIGGSTTTRKWDIKITQYACGDEQGGNIHILRHSCVTVTIVFFRARRLSAIFHRNYGYYFKVRQNMLS